LKLFILGQTSLALIFVEKRGKLLKGQRKLVKLVALWAETSKCVII
jgi:hypothetical protein